MTGWMATLVFNSLHSHESEITNVANSDLAGCALALLEQRVDDPTAAAVWES